MFHTVEIQRNPFFLFLNPPYFRATRFALRHIVYLLKGLLSSTLLSFRFEGESIP